MNVVLWIVQVLLGLTFVFHGYMLAVQYQQAQKQPGMAYVGALPAGLRNFIAACEVLGGIGVILPALIGIQSWLSPLAAALLAVVMVLAVLYHVQRKEFQNIGLNTVLALVAAFVAYGRFILAPF